MSSLPPHVLTSKEVAIVMLLRNLNAAKGILNETKLIFGKIYNSIKHLEVSTGVYWRANKPTATSSDTTKLLSFKHNGNFVLDLAFCTTMNKVQVGTLRLIIVVLSRGETFKNVKSRN